MRRLHCVISGRIDSWNLDVSDERFYYHIAEADATEPLTKEEIWEMLDYAVAFHKGTGTVNYFWDMMAELVKPEDLQILKERAEAIVEGGADK